MYFNAQRSRKPGLRTTALGWASTYPLSQKAGRVKHHQDPFPALHFQRQSLFGKPLPHPEISPRVPRPLRLSRRQPRFLHDVLSLVQRRSPPLRHRPVHPGHGPSSTGWNGEGKTSTRPRRGLLGSPRTLRPRPAIALAASPRGLDQQTPKLRRQSSLNSTMECLKSLTRAGRGLREFLQPETRLLAGVAQSIMGR